MNGWARREIDKTMAEGPPQHPAWGREPGDVVVSLSYLNELRGERNDLLKALSGFFWLDNNRHNYGSPTWLSFFDAAISDARTAAAPYQDDSAPGGAGTPADAVPSRRTDGADTPEAGAEL